MTIEQFTSALRNPPFRPFDLHLADGRSFSVGHPEQVAINPGMRTVHIVHADGSWNVFDLLLVTDLEFGSRAEKQAG